MNENFKFVATDVMYLDSTDTRYNEYKDHIDKEGFSPSELWNLDTSIAIFILPRLKYFRNNLHGYPSNFTFDEWKNTIDKMIKSFELMTDDSYPNSSIDGLSYDEIDKIIEEGLVLFGKYIRALWD